MQHPSISTSPSKMQASPLTWPTYPLKHVFLIGANGFVASHTLSHSSSALQLISALSNDPKRKLTKHPPTSQHPSSRLSLAIVPGTTAPAPFCLRIREHGSTLQRSHTHHVAIRVWHRVLKREVPGPSRQRQDGDPEGDRGAGARAQEGSCREQPRSGRRLQHAS